MSTFRYTPSPLQEEIFLAALRYINREHGLKPKDFADACKITSDDEQEELRSALYRGQVPEVIFDRLYDYIVSQCAIINELKCLTFLFSSSATNNHENVFSAASSLLAIDEREFSEISSFLEGRYLCKRYTSDGRIICEIITVPKYNDAHRISICTVHHYTNTIKHFAHGYIISNHRTFLFCIISTMRRRPYCYYLSFREPPKDFTHMHGIALDVNYNGIPYTSKSLCSRLPSDLNEEEVLMMCKIHSTESIRDEEKEELLKNIGDKPLLCMME